MCGYFMDKKPKQKKSKQKARTLLAENINDLAPHLELVRLTGGEPFMIPHHETILKKLKPFSRNISLEYSTNLSYDLSDFKIILDMWSNFKDVSVVFSLDGMKDVNNYIRIGSDFKRIIKNAFILFEHKKVNKIVCSFTFQALNAFDLPAIIRYLIKEPRIIFFCNVLQAPDFLNVHILPRLVKDDLIRKYILLKKEIEACKINEVQKSSYVKTIDMLIAYLKIPINDSSLIGSFLEYNLEIDKKYSLKKNFREIIPELKFLKINE